MLAGLLASIITLTSTPIHAFAWANGEAGTPGSGQASGGGGGGSTGGGGGGSTTPSGPGDDDDDDDSITIINNNYYYFDVGLQFKPKVGIVTSINASRDVFAMGSMEEVITDISDGVKIPNIYGGTSWNPGLEDLPDFIGALGRQYKYASIYSGYWGSYAASSDSGVGSLQVVEIPATAGSVVGGAGITPPTGTFTSVEPSWADRDPGAVMTDSGIEDFYTKEEKAIYDIAPGTYDKLPAYLSNPVHSIRTPWYGINNTYLYGKKGSNGVQSFKWNNKPSGTMPNTFYDPAMSNYTSTVWYRDTDVTKESQNTVTGDGNTYLPAEYNNDEMRRALNILGYDFLYRDESVTRVLAGIAKFNNTGYEGSELRGTIKGYYGYVWTPISVIDDYLLEGKDLLTLDYVIQSIYRAVGMNCLRTSTFMYRDVLSNVDFTPIAEKLSVSMDKINQVQNRLDVFVTRTALDEYWRRGVQDRLVENSGVMVANALDAVYKQNHSEASANELAVTIDGEQYTYDESANVRGKAYVELKPGTYTNSPENIALYDANRFKHISLAGFCVLLQRAMNIYGEEILTDKEQRILLAAYGSKLPYHLPTEQLNAIQYLMAKGIVEDTMYWDGPLKVDDMIIILSRVADTSSRLTFKNIDVEYNEELLDLGFYPAAIKTEFLDTPLIEATLVNFHGDGHSYANEKYFDYFLKLGDYTIKEGDVFTWDWQWTSPELVVGSPNKRTQAIKDLGTVTLKDGNKYRHIQVKIDVACSDEWRSSDGFIKINTADGNDTPEYVLVPFYGGVFKDFTYMSTEGGNSYVITYSNNCSINKSDPSTDFVLEDVSSYNIKIQDAIELYALGYDTHGPLKWNEDCIITKAVKTRYKADIKDKTKYSTFNSSCMGVNYVDYERYINGYATMLSNDPFLAPIKTSTIYENIAEKYDVIIAINEGSGNLHWVDDAEGMESIVLRENDKPLKTPKIDEGSALKDKVTIITSDHKSGEPYLFLFNGCASPEEITENLKEIGNKATDMATCTGYIKQEDTYLIPLETAKAILQKSMLSSVLHVADLTVSPLTYADNGSVRLYCISADIDAYKGTDPDFSVPFTILIDTLRNRIAVNNIIYDVPAEEPLIVKSEVNGQASFLVNWRAFQGWYGNFTSSVNQKGEITLNINNYKYKEGGINSTGCTKQVTDNRCLIEDMFTGNIAHSLYTFVKYEDEKVREELRMFPLYAPYLQSSFVLHISEQNTAKLYVARPKPFDNSVAQDVGADDFKNTFDVTLKDNYYLTSTMLIENNDFYKMSFAELINELKEKGAKEFQGKIFYETTTNRYYYILPKFDTSGIKEDGAAVTTTEYNSMDKTMFDGLRETTLPLCVSHTGTVYSTACNTYEGLPYGAVPLYALEISIATNAITASNSTLSQDFETSINKGGRDYTYYSLLTYNRTVVGTGDINGYVTMKDTNVHLYPTGLPYAAMHVPTMKFSELIEQGQSVTNILQGSLVGKCGLNQNNKTEYKPFSTGFGVGAMSFTPIGSNDTCYLVCGSTKQQYLAIDNVYFEYNSDYDNANGDDLRRKDLVNANQPGKIDWGEYTFNTLIHDIDNGLSILLIIVLNIIPRIGLFVFLILITLATISNVKPWKRFCTSIFDPYKLLTFGHADVNTVDTKRLLITSIIAMAAFALFMDGTLIHALTWISQFVMTMIER